MALTVVWEKCNVDRPNKPGEATTPVVLERGEDLPDYVTDFVRSTLVMIGAVRDLGAAVQIVQAANDADFAESPAPAQLPPEVPPVVPPAPAPVTDAEMTKPSVTDNKDTWERYAVTRGYYSQTEAESMTKAKLISEVHKRESA